MRVLSITDLPGLHAFHARVRYERPLPQLCLSCRARLAPWVGYAQATLTIALQIDARGVHSIAKVWRKEHLGELNSQGHRGEQHPRGLLMTHLDLRSTRLTRILLCYRKPCANSRADRSFLSILVHMNRRAAVIPMIECWLDGTQMFTVCWFMALWRAE